MRKSLRCRLTLATFPTSTATSSASAHKSESATTASPNDATPRVVDALRSCMSCRMLPIYRHNGCYITCRPNIGIRSAEPPIVGSPSSPQIRRPGSLNITSCCVHRPGSLGTLTDYGCSFPSRAAAVRAPIEPCILHATPSLRSVNAVRRGL